MSQLGRIGFKESENLYYEDTYARWKKVSEFNSGDEQHNDKEKQDAKLEPIEDLIEQYFNQSPNHHHLDKILFILADFGKGKSVFLRHYAAQLAKEYINKKEGLFPVYFNLREFADYDKETNLGVISDYLETDYNIKIDNAHFKKNNYIFLIDSLDESGELSPLNIDKVIASIKKIQQIDKELCRNNRIVITSRPFDEGLKDHLERHKPYLIKNEEQRDINYFIAIYGFKKQQFKHWLNKTLKSYLNLNKNHTREIDINVLENIKSYIGKDVYQLLQENNTLSTSELKRPIFAYMIYQLIINSIDFSTVGKIGVYLSFLNLLTKDAKHIHDTTFKVNLTQEFEFRNLLHAISALWMYERQQGKQGILKKADICRVLDGENKGESDTEILARYKDKGVIEIQFLSHSYFGEKANVLHFQHQSFAEILLAEYYLKVFIKYALDEEFNVEEARTKLVLGEPTEQTIQFFTEMLNLLKETATENCSKNVMEKRKLLFPLMASLATKNNNKLFCNAIYYDWFKAIRFIENQANYPKQALEHWCIDKNKIEKIIKLATAILESKTNYILARAETRTVLYDNELLVTQDKLSNFPPDMDRWLALLVGNTLYNDETEKQFFNWNINHFEHFFDLIKNWNYAYSNAAPRWAYDLFRGINMMQADKVTVMDNCTLRELNLSFSYLYRLSLEETDISGTKLENLRGFERINISSATIYGRRPTDDRIVIAEGMEENLPENAIEWVNYNQRRQLKEAIVRQIDVVDRIHAKTAHAQWEKLVLEVIETGKFTADEVNSWIDSSGK